MQLESCVCEDAEKSVWQLQRVQTFQVREKKERILLHGLFFLV